MKDFTFYLEYPNKTEKNKATRKNPGNHSGNCIAVYETTKLEQYKINRCYECASAVMDTPNSQINWGAVSPEYLAERCKKISEKQAREIHSNLLNYLEQE